METLNIAEPNFLQRLTTSNPKPWENSGTIIFIVLISHSKKPKVDFLNENMTPTFPIPIIPIIIIVIGTFLK
jgi:hypothetical protein